MGNDMSPYYWYVQINDENIFGMGNDVSPYYWYLQIDR